MAKEIDSDNIFDSAFICDPKQRAWGITSSLTPVVVFRNRQIDSSPCLNDANDWNWSDFKKYTEYIRQSKPELPYIYFFHGYMNFLFQNGISLVNPDTGKVQIDPAIISQPLESLRYMVKNKIIPVYSDLYNSNLFEKMFTNSEVAMCDGWLSQMNIISSTVKDFDILPTPVAPNCRRPVYSSMFSIMADSMNYSICREFIKYTLSPEIQQYLTDLNGEFPVRKGIKPSGLLSEQFAFMTNYINQCERFIEDYYIPFQSRFVIETGIDRWIKHGGKLSSVLKDLETSCQWRIDNLVFKV